MVDGASHKRRYMPLWLPCLLLPLVFLLSGCGSSNDTTSTSSSSNSNTSSLPQDCTLSLKATVKDDFDSSPIQGARVILHDPIGNTPAWYTNSSGIATMAVSVASSSVLYAVYNGATVYLDISASGYRDVTNQSATMPVTCGDTTYASVFLIRN